MTEEIDFKKMKVDLIKIYKDFIESPSDADVQRSISSYENEFGILQVYNDYLESQPVPKEIELALSGLSTIFQYNFWEDSNEDYSNDKIMAKAKKILAELEKA